MADILKVDQIVAAPGRDYALKALLAAARPAIVAALANDGSRVELPPSLHLGHHQALPVAGDHSTMLDVIVPADRIAVVGLWERARQTGIAVGAVRLLSQPDHRQTLSMIDVRDHFGIYVAVLTDHAAAADEAASQLPVGSLVTRLRPHTAVAHKSMTAIFADIDGNVTKMLGWTPEQMIGVRSSEFVHPDDRDRAIAGWMELLSQKGRHRIRLRHRCRDESWLWVELDQVHNGAENPDDVDVICHISDISEEMAAHEALHRREQLFSRLAESLPTGVVQLQHDRSVVYANARLGSIFGLTASATRAELLARIVDDDRPLVSAAITAAVEHGEDRQLEADIIRASTGERRRCELTVAAVSDQEGLRGALVCVSDVTDSARMREQLKIRANYDALTGCLNRASLMHALDTWLGTPTGKGTGVIFVDLNKFKLVNDRLGHAAGDQLLVHVATVLEALTRGEDVVGRLGGDEFVLICHGLELRAHAARIAARVREALDHPVHALGRHGEALRQHRRRVCRAERHQRCRRRPGRPGDVRVQAQW